MKNEFRCKKRAIVYSLLLAAFICAAALTPKISFASGSAAGSADRLEDPKIRTLLVDSLKAKSLREQGTAALEARKHFWKIKGTIGSRDYELATTRDGRPLYRITSNIDAADLTDVNLLHDTFFYAPAILGDGLTIGIWDSASVLFTHQEFDSRVSLMEADPTFGDHATHMAGTIGASGFDPLAKGMAPSIMIDSYNWNQDLAEMTDRAAASANAPSKLSISNHSYGIIAGWHTGAFRTLPADFDSNDIVNIDDFAIMAGFWLTSEPNIDIAPEVPDGSVDFNDFEILAAYWQQGTPSEPYWFGVWGEKEDRNFGRYDTITADWDDLCYNADYYLPFKAAGDDRNNNHPAVGTSYWYIDPNSGEWTDAIFDLNDPNSPEDDGWDNGGYDTVYPVSCAKNIMTVGAVDDTGSMTDFTAWGPTDDGRIKPDVVANGTGLFSANADSDANSYDIRSGTSSACANASGAAALILDYYKRLNGLTMRASSLKALLIHTTVDLGISLGPDYKHGWGLINADGAASLIKNDFEDSNGQMIFEEVLTQGGTNTYTFFSDGSTDIKATLCWTDPAGEANDSLDNNSPRLINDLDLFILDTNGTTHLPFVLDPNAPGAPATLGNNILDNVEQVIISIPAAGEYRAKVTHKGTITNSVQQFSLILSHARPTNSIFVDDDANDDPGPGDPNISDPAADGSIEHPYDSIQKAIDDTNEASIITVLDGVYTGLGNYNIDPNGKAVTIKSMNGPDNCLIDCEYNGRAFIIKSGEGATTIIQGLKIENGYAQDPNWPQKPEDDLSGFGGAILCKNSSPLITGCDINWNLADSGGGAIFCYNNANPYINDCMLSWNESGIGIYMYSVTDLNDANLHGGAIYCKDSDPIITETTISGNLSVGNGGGIATENSNAVIQSCTITLNDCWTSNANIVQNGGGVHFKGGSPEIAGSLITWNASRNSGAGIAITNSAPEIADCRITSNTAATAGGGIVANGVNAHPVITNCLIARNTGFMSGGIGFYLNSLGHIENCTIVDNDATFNSPPNYAGGLHCYQDGSAIVINSIIWNNSGTEQIVVADTISDSNATVTYSDVEMFDANGIFDPSILYPGQGNINSDPLLVRLRGDYHLKSTVGRWDDTNQEWVTDVNEHSPCIDTGDPASDYSFEPEENGDRINIGAYGNTPEASKSTN